MKERKLEFDPADISFHKAGGRFRFYAGWILSLLATSIVVTILFYGIFATFFSTDSERSMSGELRTYKKFYEEVPEKEKLLADVLAGLQHKDNSIYKEVFHSTAPGLDPIENLSYFFASDTIPEYRIYSYTRDKSDRLISRAVEVDKMFEDIAELLLRADRQMPPMVLPLKDLSYPQVGASVGSRLNPFYRAYVQHNGVDLIAVRGTVVYATADGEVTYSKNSSGNSGNSIRISHAGGYETVYAHLADRYVRQGQKVVKGQKIGTVGMSGQAYAPHLHYEVIRDGEVLDPINFFFNSVSPEEYANMLYMSVNTMQSLD